VFHDGDWVYSAQDRGQIMSVVNTAVKLWIQ